MAKTTFATFGILLVTLLTLSLTSADVESITLSINGDGESSSNPVSGENSTSHSFSFTINNKNDTYLGINVSFSGTATYLTLPSGNTTLEDEDNPFSGTIKMPDSTYEGYRQITAYFYDNSDDSLIGTDTLNVYYNSTKADDSGSDPDPTESETFCEIDSFGSETGDLKLEVDITNNGQGDEDKWEYLDDIEIEITVENENDDDSIDDVMLEILIKDKDGNTYDKDDFNINDDEEDIGRIKSDDEEVTTFTIEEVPIDLDEGTYYLYIRAYEEDNETGQCVSKSEDLENSKDNEMYFEFEVESSDDSTVIVKKNLENIVASCGQDNVEVTFTVYNTGSDDEDKVLVNLYSSTLGIDKYE
ncbi:MAG: putative S-layer protein, partial [Bacteroidales bacterium]|nr:putative S-layer protein [Bacteroidales bacterium]